MNTKNLEKYQIKINNKYVDYRLDKFLLLLQPQWSKVFGLKMIRIKNVLINEQKTTANYKLQLNDVITYYGTRPFQKIDHQKLDWTNKANLPALDVVYEDEFVIVVVKPVNIPVQSAVRHVVDNMNNRLYQHCLKQDQDLGLKHFQPVFAHRLDTNTMGLLIGAKTHQALQALTKAFKNQQVFKIYDALVWNKCNFTSKKIENFLQKNSETNVTKIVEQNSLNAKWAVTEVFVHKIFAHQTHVKLKLHTGRSHQLRVHLASINHPICGDRKYAYYPDNKKFAYQCLVASELSFAEEICVNELSGLKNQFFQIEEIWFNNPKFLVKKIN